VDAFEAARGSAANVKQTQHFALLWGPQPISSDVQTTLLDQAESSLTFFKERFGFPGTLKYKINIYVDETGLSNPSAIAQPQSAGEARVYQDKSLGGYIVIRPGNPETIPHEVAHIMQLRGDNWYWPENDADLWFTESFAEYMASAKRPENFIGFDEYLKKLTHVGLQNRAVQYKLWPFHVYLENRFGVPFMRQIWQECPVNERPFDCIARMQRLSVADLIGDWVKTAVTWSYSRQGDVLFQSKMQYYQNEMNDAQGWSRWTQVNRDVTPQGTKVSPAEKRLEPFGFEVIRARDVLQQQSGCVDVQLMSALNMDAWRYVVVKNQWEGVTTKATEKTRLCPGRDDDALIAAVYAADVAGTVDFDLLVTQAA
jgi:hypothetical protein